MGADIFTMTSTRRRRRLIILTVCAIGILLMLNYHSMSKAVSQREESYIYIEPPHTTTKNNHVPQLLFENYDKKPPRSMEELLATPVFLPQQSRTLEEARRVFKARYHREPPQGFDNWFAYAKNKSCVIDNYDWIDSDLAPYRAVQAKNSTTNRISQLEVIRIAELLDSIVIFNVTSTSVEASPEPWYLGRFQDHLADFLTYILPNVSLVFAHNARSEPRIIPMHEYKKSGLGWARPSLTTVINPNATSALADGVLIAEQATGFERMINSCSQHPLVADQVRDHPRSDHSFFGIGNNVTNTEWLLPVFGQARIHNCYNDLQIPSHYTIGDEFLSEIETENILDWEDRKPILFWRGSSTGQINTMENWRQNHRIQNLKYMQQLAATYPNRTIIDAGMIGFVQCDEETCEEMRQVLGDAVWKVPREEHWQYKYLLVNDGNVMASRLPHFLYGGSLVFLTSIFQHNWEEWLVPWVHYIPVRPDLSNLEERLQWAWENDDMAKQIAKNGRQFASRYISQDDLKCWTYRVLLDYNELFETV